MGRREIHKVYIKEKLNPIFKLASVDLLQQKPSNPGQFLLEWLQDFSGLALVGSEKEELERLRITVKKAVNQTANSQSETESDEDEEDDEFVDELPISIKVQKPRTSVSAEAFGLWNKKGDFKPRVIPKTEEQKQRIIERLSRAFMFQALEGPERDIVINSMDERKFLAKDVVIQQGADGNELFIVDSGQLNCYKVFKPGQAPTYLKTYQPGESFGELSLLYNAPRAAWITAKTDSVCWSLDRDVFNHIVKDSAMRRREQYEEFLSKVELLSDMDPYERSQLADALKNANFNNGDYLIREGDWGDVFYFIVEGNAIATKTLSPDRPPATLKEYKPGDYFGELALLRGEPRAANIIATSQVKCVTLDGAAFKRMLGPIEQILQRNAEKYEKILKELEQQ